MTNKFLKETYLIKENTDNTGLLPSDKWHVKNKRPINPLYTVLNTTFTEKSMKKVIDDHKKGKVNIEYLEKNQEGIITAYKDFYGENWKDILKSELDQSKDFLGTGLKKVDDCSPRSIHITNKQWQQYMANGGYNDYCFSCEARPDILVFDFDVKLTDDQFQKIERAFKSSLYVIEKNTEKGTSHIYIQCSDNNPITKIKAGLKENKEDESPLDIDIFKGGLKHIACATPSRSYEIIYDGNPSGSITVDKAITMLSKTLNLYLDRTTLKEIITPKTHQKTSTIKKVNNDEITVISNNEKNKGIIDNAIPIFTELAGKGIREELYKSLAGALLNNGFNNNDTLQIMTNIYNNTIDEDPRLTTVENAITRYQNGEKITGWSTFQKIVQKNTKSRKLKRNLKEIGNIIFIKKPETKRIIHNNGNFERTIILEENNDQIYNDYPETSENNETLYTISHPHSNYKIIVDYEHKHIAKRTITIYKNGDENQVDTVIITAVPINLEVYNDTICNTGKQYKCIWQFEDGTETEIAGDIPKHKRTLEKGAGVWEKSQLQNTISAVFGDLTKTKYHGTIVKNTPLKKGFYWDSKQEKIIVVDHEILTPTFKQLKDALILLDEYSNFFGSEYFNPEGVKGEDYEIDPETKEKVPTFKVDSTRFAVFIRWCLNAPFHFVRKQLGMTNEKYIFLSGESGVGKTYGYIMAGLFMLGIEDPKDYMVSGGTNSKAQISKNLGKTTFPIFIDEGDRIFNNENLTSMLKHSVQGVNSREVTDTDLNELMKEKALAPLGFSANNQFEDTEKGALTNRIITLPFYSYDVPSRDRQELFEERFNTHYSPEDKRRAFKWIGYAYQSWILENSELYIKYDQDEIVKMFFNDVCPREMTDWIFNDIEKVTAEDNRKDRHDQLMNILKILLNKEMKQVVIKDNEESLFSQKLIEDSMDAKNKILSLAESNQVSWLQTNKNKNCLIITSGVLKAIKKEDSSINISTMEEFKDILLLATADKYEIGRYRANINGKSKQLRNTLKLDNVEIISSMYELAP